MVAEQLSVVAFMVVEAYVIETSHCSGPGSRELNQNHGQN